MKCHICGKSLNDVLEHVEHILHECSQIQADQMLQAEHEQERNMIQLRNK
ncbi:hypothetical protein ACFSVM_23745 [Paenibacillus shunpengii]|uniref:C2H2-type domain-containing protein n=2 Tax=Paenibacillus TaxID=44249 RepID=A0ABW5SVX1_9BACL